MNAYFYVMYVFLLLGIEHNQELDELINNNNTKLYEAPPIYKLIINDIFTSDCLLVLK